jgi:AcrR family transcriptional regulator
MPAASPRPGSTTIEHKEQLLIEIMHYGMDVFEERPLRGGAHPDPVERLKACMARNIKLVTRGWSKEVTIILHEHDTLTGKAQAQINARKKHYVRFLESSFAEAVERQLIRPVDPTIAAFAFLGMVLWIYKWFKPGGKRTDDEIAAGMVDLLFTGLVPRS